ncbi:PAS domain S-box protein [uncultured Nostoc sp.]|uniref:PAS domain S-box protein n=1 Tax=uncultured Nostoc sp. TaxID=340711 RepID=UPI0035CB4478
MTTVFFVEDSAEDRALYRRFLEQDDRYTYDIYEFESGNKALQACQEKIPDVILLDFQLPDLGGLEFLTQLQRQTSNSQVSVIMLARQRDETIAVQAIKNGADDYLVKGKLTCENFCRTIHGAIKHKQLMQQLEQQQEHQRLVGAIALNIRQSLKLQDILATSVKKVCQLFKADRVLVYQFTHKMHGSVVAESILPQWAPIFGLEIEATCFQENHQEEYRQGKIWAATNIYEAGLSNSHIQLLEQFQVKANLVVPILLENKGTQALEWGLFIVHQCSAPRQWQTFEVELLNQLTVQLAIAIQQAQLYHNLQTLNTELEAKVEERTAKLHQSDRRFRAIFNNTFQFTGLLTPSGILLEANQTALSFGGLKLEDVIDRPFWEAHWWTISPQTQAELKRAIARAAKGEFIRYEVDVLGANNRVATIDFSLRPLLYETGKVVLLIPEGRDITELKQAKEKLQQSEALLATTQKIAHIGSWEFNLETKKRYWSMETFRISGLNPTQGEPTQAELLEIIHPDDRAWMEAQLEQAISTTDYAYAQEAPFNLEYRIIRPDGSVRYVESKAEIAYDAQGQPVKLLGGVLDITERKQTELEIIRSRDLLEAVYNESADALFLVNVETLLIADCNERAVKLFAASSKAELINIQGNTLQKQPFTSDEIATFMEEINQQGFWSREVEYITKQGKPFWGNIAAKQITVAGTVMQLVRITDITARKYDEEDRKRSEFALRESEERLQLALEASGDALWDWNILTRQVYYSPRYLEMLGYRFDELPQDFSTWERLVHPDDLPWVEKILADHLKDSSTQYKFDYRLRTKSGEYKWIANYGKVVMRDADGNPLRMTGTHRDISDRQAALRERKQTEAALAKSEEQLRLTLEFNHIGLWDWNVQTGEVIWNDNHYRLLGLDPEISAASYQLWRDRVHPEDVDRIEQAVSNALAQHINFQGEYRVIFPDGRVHWLTGKGRGVYNEAGKPVRMLGVIIDINERKILERELAHKQKLLDTFINSAPVGITILDRELRYSLINEALAEINGIPAAAHFGKTPWEIVPDIAPKQEQVFRHILTTGEPILDLEISGETPKFPGVIRTWLASYFPIQSEADQPISIGVVVVEISDRKRAEQMLELQAVITRNMAEGICLVRAIDGVFVYANPKFEQMFGYHPGELIGQHVSIVNYGNENNTPEDVSQGICTAILEHGEATYEVHNIKKDGTPFWCSATASVFEHPEYGNVLVAIQQDITEQKQAEEKIKASLKEKEVLLKEIHHRVKNNLGIVSSLLQMQCRRTQDPVVTAILRDSQNRIASIALVHEKLYRSQDLADLDFAQYIPDLTTHLFDSYNVSSSQIQLNIQVDNASLDIETAIPCGLIINELVSNALKYAFAGNREGKIEVKFYQEFESALTLIIRDNGVGLPENFDSKKTKTLGITLVQGLVKQLKGKLEIDSQQGTEFKITFTNSRS